jgi:hypothetical protein
MMQRRIVGVGCATLRKDAVITECHPFADTRDEVS